MNRPPCPIVRVLTMEEIIRACFQFVARRDGLPEDATVTGILRSRQTANGSGECTMTLEITPDVPKAPELTK
jgi:hypothetical protein